MKSTLLLISTLLLLAPVVFAETNSQWILEKSELTYHLSHPLHKADGASQSAKGKGVCTEKGCEFLVAAPVRSFVSGDTNRDLHMLETTRGAEHPLVTVLAKFPSLPTDSKIMADLEVNFAGEKHTYSNVPFTVSMSDKSFQITGSVPMTLRDFNITPPSLLTIEVKNDVPIDVSATWGKQ